MNVLFRKYSRLRYFEAMHLVPIHSGLPAVAHYHTSALELSSMVLWLASYKCIGAPTSPERTSIFRSGDGMIRL